MNYYFYRACMPHYYPFPILYFDEHIDKRQRGKRNRSYARLYNIRA